MKRPFRFVWLVALFTSFCVVQLLAQVDTASLQGRVEDTTGAVVPSASVSATNVATNFTYRAKSDANGQWVISPVVVGTYSVTITAPGFKVTKIGPVILNVQQSQRLDTTLQPGQVSQSVEVRGASPLLQTSRSELGQVITNHTMVKLPLNGRNPVQLAQLTVGVTTGEPGGRASAAYSFSANGARSMDNNFLLDGVDNNSNLPDILAEANYVVMPPPDALQEFKVQTGDYSAEFGRATGAIVNAVTASGSNQFHGDLYEFFRNQNLDAMNYFDSRLQPFHQNQFGATLGGPIVRNRLFFFIDYQGLRVSEAEPSTSQVPTAAQQHGDFTSQLNLSSPTGVLDCNGHPTYQGELFDTTLTRASSSSPTGFCGVPFGYAASGAPSNVIPNTKMDVLGERLIALYPAPNANAQGFNYLSDPNETQVMDQGDVRVDQVFSQKDTAFYRYSENRNPSTIPSPFPGLADGGGFFSGVQNINSYSLAAAETHIFSSSMVNVARFGFNHQLATRFQFNFDQNISQQLGFPGVPYVAGTNNGGLPQLTFSDASTLGSPTYLPSTESQSTYSGSDTLTLVVGNQTLKIGGEVRPEEFSFNQPPASRGSMNFGPQFTDNPGDPGSGGSGLATLLTGQPGGGMITNIANGNYIRQTFGLFLQDDWRVLPKLTLNLGLRYDYFSPPREKANRQANFNYITGALDIPHSNRSAVLPPVLAALVPVNYNVSNGLLDKNWKDFSPRIGAAYQISPKLVMQTAFGVFFSPYEGGIWGYAGTNPPFLLSQSYSTPCSLPSYNSAASDCSIPNLSVLSQGFSPNALIDANSPFFVSYQKNLDTPYSMLWHMSFQYELRRDTVLETSYVGSRSNKQYIEPNINQASPTTDPSAPFAPRRPFPKIDGGISAVLAEGFANYNALQLSLNHRLAGGLSAIVNYTYSKALGNASTTMGDQNNSAFRYGLDPGAEYGPLDFDVRNRFTADAIYQLPVGRGQAFLGSAGPVADRLLGHWTLTGIVTLSSGNWFTVTDANGNFANSDGQQRPDFVPGQKASGKPCVPGTFFNTCAFANPPEGSFGNVSLNSLEGPGNEDVDFSVQKIIPIRERRQIELRAEAFNIFNHPNKLFAAPGPQNGNNATAFGAPGFGFLTGALPPREIQLAAKFFF